jgi:hypothetical protein
MYFLQAALGKSYQNTFLPNRLADDVSKPGLNRVSSRKPGDGYWK